MRRWPVCASAGRWISTSSRATTSTSTCPASPATSGTRSPSAARPRTKVSAAFRSAFVSLSLSLSRPSFVSEFGRFVPSSQYLAIKKKDDRLTSISSSSRTCPRIGTRLLIGRRGESRVRLEGRGRVSCEPFSFFSFFFC